MSNRSMAVAIPADVADGLRSLIAQAQIDWERHPTGVGNASHGGALPLSLDLRGVSALKLDGTVVTFGWEQPGGQQPVATARARDIALAIGARRYPILGRLLPKNEAGSHECPECHGTGAHPLSSKFGVDSLTCSCGGLGWIPEYWESA